MQGSTMNRKYVDAKTAMAERRENVTIWLILIKKSTKLPKKRKIELLDTFCKEGSYDCI
jgi:hypothetical protein